MSASADGTTGGAALRRRHLTVQQKVAIIQKKFEEPQWTQAALGRWAKERFSLAKPPTQATISNILRTREQLVRASASPPDACRVRAVKHPSLDAAVHAWVLNLERSGAAYSRDDIREKALQLGYQLQLPRDAAGSNAWMASFIERHQLTLRKSQPSQHAYRSASGSGHRSERGAERVAEEPWTQSALTGSGRSVESPVEPPAITEVIAQYAPRDVFAMDEVGLWYCLEPRKTKSRRAPQQQHAARAALPSSGGAKRISLALAVNMDASEKLEQFFVGSTKQQQQEPVSSVGRCYCNSSACVTAPIFRDWLLRFNSAMLEQSRKVLLLVDDAPSHVLTELSNVRTLVLPGKRAHPIGVGIGRTFKTLFRIRHLAHAVDQAERGVADIFEVEQIQAMRWAKQAWLEVSADAIRRCWDHTRLRHDTNSSTATSHAVRMDQHMEDAICGYLAHLGLLYQVSIDGLVSPAGEDDVHYVYNDATISDLVLRKCSREEVADEQTAGEQQYMTKKKRRRVDASKRAELFRDAIAVLDDDSEIDDDLVHAIQFLRKRQAAARLDVKRSQAALDGEGARLGSSGSAQPTQSEPCLRSSVGVSEDAVRGAQELRTLI